jgi:hypothetical protein
MYVLVLVDLTLPEFIDIIYSVHVGRTFLLADRRNLPFSTSTAVEMNIDNMSNSNTGNKILQVDEQEKTCTGTSFFYRILSLIV